MSEKEVFDYRYQIKLTTFEDIFEFFRITNMLSGKIVLKDSSDVCICAKSVLGAMMLVNWDELYCESEKDIYENIKKFCVQKG